MKTLRAAVLLCLLSLAAGGQDYYVKQYRVGEGLPSDIIKACTQDSLGYFWIATDEGIVKFDGIRFTSYRHATRSNYAKGFITTRSGRLLAYGDLDLIEIHHTGDSVRFERLYAMSRITSDSALSYPKQLYEDRAGVLWVSEMQAVVKLHDGKFTRYPFELADRSPLFLRSFTFFEDQQGTLYVVSVPGNVFRYDAGRDRFEPAAGSFPVGVESVLARNDSLLVGTVAGVSMARLLPAGGFTTPEQVWEVPDVSYISALPDGRFFVATHGFRQYVADFRSRSLNLLATPVNNVNHVYVSPERDLWISGNEGMVLMHENLFRAANDGVADFIESIAEDPATGTIYYATRTKLYAFNPATQQNRTVLDIPNGYFQSLLYTDQGLWITNAFKVIRFSGGSITKVFDFSNVGRFITRMSLDSAGNVWLALPGDRRAYSIDPNLKLHAYSVPLGTEGVINSIRQGNDGIYIASAGSKSYLFYKGDGDSTFRNVSLPLTGEPRGDFDAGELVATDGALWLATTEGLLKYDGKSAQYIELGNGYAGLPAKSVQRHPSGQLLVSNAHGVVLYHVATGESDLYNEGAGLLSNTTSNHALFVASDQRVWIGTAKGLSYSIAPLSQLSRTPKPLFVAVRINGQKAPSINGNTIAYGNLLSIDVSSITFPENGILLQYRFIPDDRWTNVTSPELQFSSLPAGAYTLEVRTKKNGPYSWSEPSRINFTVASPFWQRSWFFALCLAATLGLVLLTYFGVERRNHRKNQELQLLIDDRTEALRKSNEELISLNLEKNNLIEIVAHDLKSPLNQIIGLLCIIRMSANVDGDVASYISLMEGSAQRLTQMIAKILDVDAIDSHQMNLTMEVMNLSAICAAVADRFADEARRKEITIERAIGPEVFATVDKNYMNQVLDNLVSNAIKFSPFQKRVFISLYTQHDKVICEIRDEGPGISESDMKKLFGKFQRLSARPTGNEISTGLGLSIVKRYVKAMNGEIRCESVVGEGTRFFVSFQLPVPLQAASYRGEV